TNKPQTKPTLSRIFVNAESLRRLLGTGAPPDGQQDTYWRRFRTKGHPCRIASALGATPNCSHRYESSAGKSKGIWTQRWCDSGHCSSSTNVGGHDQLVHQPAARPD